METKKTNPIFTPDTYRTKRHKKTLYFYELVLFNSTILLSLLGRTAGCRGGLVCGISPRGAVSPDDTIGAERPALPVSERPLDCVGQIYKKSHNGRTADACKIVPKLPLEPWLCIPRRSTTPGRVARPGALVVLSFPRPTCARQIQARQRACPYPY